MRFFYFYYFIFIVFIFLLDVNFLLGNILEIFLRSSEPGGLLFSISFRILKYFGENFLQSIFLRKMSWFSVNSSVKFSL